MAPPAVSPSAIAFAIALLTPAVRWLKDNVADEGAQGKSHESFVLVELISNGYDEYS
jgi:hypothetical protein